MFKRNFCSVNYPVRDIMLVEKNTTIKNRPVRDVICKMVAYLTARHFVMAFFSTNILFLRNISEIEYRISDIGYRISEIGNRFFALSPLRAFAPFSPLSRGEGSGERSLFCPFRAQYCIALFHRALPCAGIFRAFSPALGNVQGRKSEIGNRISEIGYRF